MNDDFDVELDFSNLLTPEALAAALKPAAPRAAPRAAKFKELTPEAYHRTGGPRFAAPRDLPRAWHVTPTAELAARRYSPEAFATATYRPEHFIGIYPAF